MAPLPVDAPARPRWAWAGVAAIVFSALYLLSDVYEELEDGFSTPQLLLTLVAEAAIPVFVVGLALAQRPKIGRLGIWSAGAYAYAYVFFTATVVYALVDGTPDYDALTDDLGLAMTVHGAIMVVAGIGFGVAVIRARVFPAWTGAVLVAGVVAVAATQDASGIVPLIATGLRDLAFAGMGVALLRSRTSPTRAAARRGPRPAPAGAATPATPAATPRTPR